MTWGRCHHHHRCHHCLHHHHISATLMTPLPTLISCPPLPSPQGDLERHKCPVGTYTDKTTSTSCDPCSPCAAGDGVTSACTAVQNTVCFTCAVGEASVGGNSSCTACDANERPNESQSACIPCVTCGLGEGFVSGCVIGGDNTKCVACSEGEYSEGGLSE